MRAAKISAVHASEGIGGQFDQAGAGSEEVAPSRVSRLHDVEGRRQWAAGKLQGALEASGLSQRDVARLAGFGRSHLLRLLNGEAPLAFGDLRRLPRRVVEPLLVRALAEVRASAPAVPRSPLQLYMAAVDATSTVLRETVAKRSARAAWTKLIAIAEEAIAAEGS